MDNFDRSCGSNDKGGENDDNENGNNYEAWWKGNSNEINKIPVVVMYILKISR